MQNAAVNVLKLQRSVVTRGDWGGTGTGGSPLLLTNNDVLKDVGIVVRCSCHCGTKIKNRTCQNWYLFPQRDPIYPV